jgi:DNA polymerase III subunit gamma/tau
VSYLVLARKYRPQKFDEVVGQEHITELFKKAIDSKRIAHAFLFTGPRGIGKTSCARILAKSLNCEKGPTLNPCGECGPCKEITNGNSFDVIEIDGASNRGIDEIRTLRENVKFAPSYGRYKIYIVDEVHMLTSEAFNALLKTLEEPPEHVKFIFATTEANKVPVTIISRCQRFDFKRISINAMMDNLKAICVKEKFKADDDALFAIAKAAQGSMRDALSILDQLGALSRDEVKSSDVFSMLGLVEIELLFELVDHLCAKNCAGALETFYRISERGKDVKQLGKDLAEHFRHLMVIKVGGKTLGKLIDYPVAQKDLLLGQSQKLSLPEILKSIELFIEAQEVARITESNRMPLELAFAKITYQGEGMKAPAAPAAKPAAAPVSRPAAPVAAQEPAKAIVDRLRDNKGQAVVSSPSREEAVPETPDSGDQPMEEALHDASVVNISTIRQVWNALTYEVSRQKMSVATYLQEGNPYAFKDNKLVIAFTPDFTFQKEGLEHKDNQRLVEDIFSQKLRQKISIQFILMDAHVDQAVDPSVDNAVNVFKGKVVNQWHNE